MSRKHPPLPITTLFTNATIASNSNLYLPFVGKELAEWIVSLPKPLRRMGGDDQPPAERRATDLEARDRRLVVGDETILRELDEGVEVRVVSVDVQSHDISPLKG